jgi:hypothetical protein
MRCGGWWEKLKIKNEKLKMRRNSNSKKEK